MAQPVRVNTGAVDRSPSTGARVASVVVLSLALGVTIFGLVMAIALQRPAPETAARAPLDGTTDPAYLPRR
jgi:hypothetical protein